MSKGQQLSEQQIEELVKMMQTVKGVAFSNNAVCDMNINVTEAEFNAVYNQLYPSYRNMSTSALFRRLRAACDDANAAASVVTNAKLAFKEAIVRKMIFEKLHYERKDKELAKKCGKLQLSEIRDRERKTVFEIRQQIRAIKDGRAFTASPSLPCPTTIHTPTYPHCSTGIVPPFFPTHTVPNIPTVCPSSQVHPFSPFTPLTTPSPFISSPSSFWKDPLWLKDPSSCYPFTHTWPYGVHTPLWLQQQLQQQQQQQQLQQQALINSPCGGYGVSPFGVGAGVSPYGVSPYGWGVSSCGVSPYGVNPYGCGVSPYGVNPYASMGMGMGMGGMGSMGMGHFGGQWGGQWGRQGHTIPTGLGYRQSSLSQDLDYSDLEDNEWEDNEDLLQHQGGAGVGAGTGADEYENDGFMVPDMSRGNKQDIKQQQEYKQMGMGGIGGMGGMGSFGNGQKKTTKKDTTQK